MGLKEKLLAREATLGVIGLGYVGLPLAVEKAKAGFKVYGFDVQKEKVDMVNAGKNYIGDVVNEDLEALVKAGQLVATANFADAAKCDCVCICVPTPLDAHQQPDISYVRSSTESIMPYIHKDMLVVLESTTYPGTTEELCKPILEKSGLKCGEDFYLAFSPERVDPGNLIYKTKNTPKVVGGCTPKCTEIAAAMYETVLEAPVYKVSSPAIAEMEKILENTYRNVNIGLINELAILCDRMGINIWEVIDAAKTANVHHYIRTLSHGYDSMINEEGNNISQGEKQLLTIARAILKDPSILILDEATSSVDTRLERRLQEAMQRVMEGRTSFVIAHRLSTIKNADLILVIQHGDIVEQGTHESLLAKQGIYEKLYHSQFETQQ